MKPDEKRQISILPYIPAAMQVADEVDGPFPALIDASHTLVKSCAKIIDRDRELFEPHKAPREMLAFVASWLGYGYWFTNPEDPNVNLSLNEGFPPGEICLRKFLANWPRIHKLRGTVKGLKLFLELATGTSPFTINESPEYLHIRVVAPQEASGYRDWLDKVIASERPIHLTWSLDFFEQKGSP